MKARTVAPYFTVVALIHAGAVATRFDLVAAKIPPSAALALMVAQFPLILLSSFFEGRIDYDPGLANFPRWMQIRSRPVKLAFTFAFIYLSCVALQTWNVSIGPINPTPPLEWPAAQRALWFAMFTAGMFFPFYLAATSLVIPVGRVLTRPLRALPPPIGAVLALIAGGGIGIVVFAAVTSTKLAAFVAGIHETIAANPAIAIGITLVTVFGPLVLGLVLGRDD
jgi:hypothetical protein